MNKELMKCQQRKRKRERTIDSTKTKEQRDQFNRI